MLPFTCEDASRDSTTDSDVEKTGLKPSDLTGAVARGHFMMRLCANMSTIFKEMSPCACFPTLFCAHTFLHRHTHIQSKPFPVRCDWGPDFAA